MSGDSVREDGNAAGRAYVRRLDEAARSVRACFGEIPKTLIILGSGLGSLTEMVSVKGSLP
jgi:purine nucleoside phosphorylase